MRIIGGEFKGVPIDSPKGLDTRPTYDRVRESLLSIIISAKNGSLEGLVALDAFGGSGAVGFELISRGASGVIAFEQDKKSAQIIKNNTKKLRIQKSQYTLFTKNIFTELLSCLKTIKTPVFDIVFLDPPYKTDVALLEDLLDKMLENNLMSKDCITVYEREKGRPTINLDYLDGVKSKTYGNTCLDCFEIR